MTIRIEITDPHLMDKNAIIKTAKYLMGLVEMGMTAVPFNQPMQVPVAPIDSSQISEKRHNPFAGLPIGTAGQQAEIQDNGGTVWKDKPPIAPGTAVNIFGDPIARPGEDTPQESPVSGAELDSANMPWDHRIHSRTRSKTSDGRWRYQRGVDDSRISAVESEIVRAAAIPVPTPPAPIAMAPLSVPIPPVLESEPDEAPIADFPSLMTKVTSLINAGKITSQGIIKIVQDSGLTSLAVVATRPDLIPSIIDKIDLAVGA